MDFRRETNGYCVKEVDIALARLKAEYEAKIKEKDSTISTLERKINNLQDIVMDYVSREEKTENILASTQNIRALEQQRLQLLYKKWTNTLQQLKNKVVPILSQEELQNLTQDFQYALKVVVDSSTSSKQTSISYAKSVLTRMSGIIPHSTDKTMRKNTSHVAQQVEREVVREEKEQILKAPSQAEKFLNGESKEIPKSLGLGREMLSIPPKEFTDSLPKKQGFSLEEALTPKESLAEIMTAFNLDD